MYRGGGVHAGLTVHFEGEEKGQNFLLDVRFTFEYEGLYWFRIGMDGKPLTAIPLRVKYDRIRAQ